MEIVQFDQPDVLTACLFVFFHNLKSIPRRFFPCSASCLRFTLMQNSQRCSPMPPLDMLQCSEASVARGDCNYVDRNSPFITGTWEMHECIGIYGGVSNIFFLSAFIFLGHRRFLFRHCLFTKRSHLHEECAFSEPLQANRQMGRCVWCPTRGGVSGVSGHPKLILPWRWRCTLPWDHPVWRWLK